jgi:hypothetical protein
MLSAICAVITLLCVMGLVMALLVGAVFTGMLLWAVIQCRVLRRGESVAEERGVDAPSLG